MKLQRGQYTVLAGLRKFVFTSCTVALHLDSLMCGRLIVVSMVYNFIVLSSHAPKISCDGASVESTALPRLTHCR